MLTCHCFAVLVVSVLLLWDELLFGVAVIKMPGLVDRVRSLQKQKSSGSSHNVVVSYISTLVAVAFYCQPALMMTTETLQIISSFKQVRPTTPVPSAPP
jgi:hypothetical protein